MGQGGGGGQIEADGVSNGLPTEPSKSFLQASDMPGFFYEVTYMKRERCIMYTS